MSLTPLLHASPAIQLHAFAAMAAFALGALVVAGLFTLLPGRIMHTIVLGGP